MDYEELAKRFCRLNYLQGIKLQAAGSPISVERRKRRFAVYLQ